MNTEELEFILQKGEGYLVEFKEKIDKSFTRELVAFANGGGGRIFLGVSDKNEAIGISIDNKIKSQIQDIARNINPQVFIDVNVYDDILIISVCP